MTKRHLLQLAMIAVFIYIVLCVSSAAERYVAVAVGSHYSQEFATKIDSINSWREQEPKTNRDEAARTGLRIIYARRGVRAAIALAVSAFMVYFPAWMQRKRLGSHAEPRA